jgi:hypothetical protein
MTWGWAVMAADIVTVVVGSFADVGVAAMGIAVDPTVTIQNGRRGSYVSDLGVTTKVRKELF